MMKYGAYTVTVFNQQGRTILDFQVAVELKNVSLLNSVL
jgi:hypothetical protein